jgi:hypothetical protein
MSEIPTTTRYEISREQLFDGILSDGIHRRTLNDGSQIEAHVQGGRIVGYTAHDASGQALSVRRLRLTDAANVSSRDETPECMYCICKEYTCKCWVEPCPQ